MKTHQEKLEQIKNAVDNCTNFSEFLEILAKVCYEKEELVRTNRITHRLDELAASMWAVRGDLIADINSEVETRLEI